MATILFSYWRSSSTWRVRLALALKEIPYRTQPIHLLRDGGEQNTESFRHLNPNGTVPTLVIDGRLLSESLPIIEYLEEVYPESTRLLPSDPYERFQARRVAELVNAGIQPLQNLRVLQKVMADFDVNNAGKLQWGRHWIAEGFEAIEALLLMSSGEYRVGDEITIADLYLIPQVYNAHRFGVDMSAYPTIVRIDAELSTHPAFVAAHPSQQPDAE